MQPARCLQRMKAHGSSCEKKRQKVKRATPIRRRRRKGFHNEKARRHDRASRLCEMADSWEEKGCRPVRRTLGGGAFKPNSKSRLDCGPSDPRDVGAIDTDIAQLTVRHAVQFVAGLPKLAPVVERACHVHRLHPSSCGRVSAAEFDSRNIGSEAAFVQCERSILAMHPLHEKPCGN